MEHKHRFDFWILIFTSLNRIDLNCFNEIPRSCEAGNVGPPGGICAQQEDSLQGASPVDIDFFVYLLGVLSGMFENSLHVNRVDSALRYSNQQERRPVLLDAGYSGV